MRIKKTIEWDIVSMYQNYLAFLTFSEGINIWIFSSKESNYMGLPFIYDNTLLYRSAHTSGKRKSCWAFSTFGSLQKSSRKSASVDVHKVKHIRIYQKRRKINLLSIGISSIVYRSLVGYFSECTMIKLHQWQTCLTCQSQTTALYRTTLTQTIS